MKSSFIKFRRGLRPQESEAVGPRGHLRRHGATDNEATEVTPVDLFQLAKQRAQAQIGFAAGRGWMYATRWRK